MEALHTAFSPLLPPSPHPTVTESHFCASRLCPLSTGCSCLGSPRARCRATVSSTSTCSHQESAALCPLRSLEVPLCG